MIRQLTFLTCLCLAASTAPAYSVSSERIHAAADLAADFLMAIQTETGLFIYDVSFSKTKPSEPSSIVRQAGTGFALAEYLQAARTQRAQRAVRNVLAALQRHSIQFGNSSRWLVSGDRALQGARTGATALALLTEILYFRSTGDGRFEAARLGWRNGLLALMVPGQGFRRTPLTDRQSPYFDGEAWLALAQYFDAFRDPATDALLKGLDRYLLTRYGREPHIGFYHWGVMAAAVRFGTTDDRQFIAFVEQQTRHYLDVLRPRMHPDANTCYAVEGLATARTLLANRQTDLSLFKVLNDRVEAETRKNLSLQLVDPESETPPAAKTAGMSSLTGLFFARSNRSYSRIDHTQHCLSALLKLVQARSGAAEK